MPDAPVSALEPRLQRLVAKARAALEQDSWDYTIEVCAQLLKHSPGCLVVRRLQREAALKKAMRRGNMVARVRGTLTGASLLLSSNKSAAQQIETADKILSIDPNNGPGLRLLAAAAAALDLPETAVFAWECLRDARPRDTAAVLGLSAAYLAANRPADALAAAEAVLRLRPHDSEALDLLRRASVAETMHQGNWTAGGDYRDKLREQPASVPVLEHAPAKLTEHACVGTEHLAEAGGAATALEMAQARALRQPHDAEARLALGELYLDSGDAALAASEFQQAHRNPRTRVAAAIGLGRAFQRQQQWDLAIAQFEEAKHALPTMDHAKKIACYELGVCLEAVGQPGAAIAEFKLIYRADVGFRDVAQRVEAFYAQTAKTPSGATPAG
jgi:tetratricopeptide (TPR) repeat protein